MLSVKTSEVPKDCLFDHSSYLKLQQEIEILNLRCKVKKIHGDIVAAYETIEMVKKVNSDQQYHQ